MERSKIVLLAGEDKPDIEIAAQLGISPKKADGWRNRFLDAGLQGLEKDAPRPGRTPSITPAMVRHVNLDSLGPRHTPKGHPRPEDPP